MKKTINYCLFILFILSTSCSDFLERPPLDRIEDQPAFWNSENNVRNQLIGLYTAYFPGYGEGWQHADIFRGSNVSEWTDDLAQESATVFTLNTPTTAVDAGWSFVRIRRINIIIARTSTSTLPEEVKNHLLGVARFFRAMEYSAQVQKFGDFPWYDKEILSNDNAQLYKLRTPRNEVMQNVLDDLIFAQEHVMQRDGIDKLSVNNDVVQAYTSKIMLFEGTWQKYRENDNTLAKKYLQVAKEASNSIIESNKYQIINSYKSITSSLSLVGNSEMILFREYVFGIKTHSQMSWQIMEPQISSPSKDLIESYLSSNGLPIHQANNGVYQGDKMFASEIAHRDPRFYGNIDTVSLRLKSLTANYAVSGYLSHRFVDQKIALTPEGQNAYNATDAPVMRYAEVLLNQIETLAELAELGEASLQQSDFDKTINMLRSRPGIVMPHLSISGSDLSVNGIVISDPERLSKNNEGQEVSSILWEIRRERRVEMVYEGGRFNDLRRWGKLDYADMKLNKKLNLGAWIDIDAYIATISPPLSASEIEKFKESTNLDRPGTIGYIKPITDETLMRTAASKDYLYPVPMDQIKLYEDQGVTLTQNPGWN
ncbi:hypothetical protein AwDysgo_13470 [Bacteroidales bacterium]|nr:hypothetical protein AwDysgo_13470 [Bacteroidales bacterium]